jgi:hypothetical protein
MAPSATQHAAVPTLVRLQLHYRLLAREQVHKRLSRVLPLQNKAVQAVALSTLVGSFMSAGNAAAALELGQIAAGDNRIGAIALLFAPVVGWVRLLLCSMCT